MNAAADSIDFMARTEVLRRHEPQALSPLGAGLLVALELGLADNSRGFARLLGIEHALVLREIAQLSGPGGFLTVTARDPRTLRTTFALTARGAALHGQLPNGLPPRPERQSLGRQGV